MRRASDALRLGVRRGHAIHYGRGSYGLGGMARGTRALRVAAREGVVVAHKRVRPSMVAEPGWVKKMAPGSPGAILSIAL